MLARIHLELLSWLAGRFRSRAELELEVIALRHQLAILHRQRPGRPQLFALDRLFWIWLYRVWPKIVRFNRRSKGIKNEVNDEAVHPHA
jgi:hypothetical protein